MLRRFLRLSREATILFSLGCLGLCPTGCALSVGGGSDEVIHKETLGKQLMDLKAAKDQGAISEEEYQREKEKLVQSAQR